MRQTDSHFFPKSFATFFKSIPCASNPLTAVTNFRLFRSTRLIYTIASFLASASRFSAAAALASFFAESFSARLRASTERVEREAFIASVGDKMQCQLREKGVGGGHCCGRTFGVELLVHFRMLVFEPVFAFFRGAAEFAILGWWISL